MRLAAFLLSLFVGTPAAALSVDDLPRHRYRLVECRFTERCLIGKPCEWAWRQSRWHVNDKNGTAYREYQDGRLRKGVVFMDTRWEERSGARSIFLPMREAVASHLTIFDGGGAIYSLQYAPNPGSGQFRRGTCEMAEDQD